MNRVFSLFTIVKVKGKVKLLSCVWLFATPWTVAYQDPLSMGFSRQEYWSGLPFPSPLLLVGEELLIYLFGWQVY